MSEQVNNVKSCLRCGSELELQKGSYPMGSTLFSQAALIGRPAFSPFQKGILYDQRRKKHLGMRRL